MSCKLEVDSLRHLHQLPSHLASWLGLTPFPAMSHTPWLVEITEAEQKLVALLFHHHQYCNHLLAPESGFPPSLLFLL